MTELPYRRTYEPFSRIPGLGRFFVVPLQATYLAPLVSYAASWQDNWQYWGPTLVFRFPFTRIGLGVGVWLRADLSAKMVRDEDAEFDAYRAVNGPVDRLKWDSARRKIAEMGLDPDEEMEMMQSMGVFE